MPVFSLAHVDTSSWTPDGDVTLTCEEQVMAPRFKRNMYRTYSKAEGADGLVCFSEWIKDILFEFRDRLTDEIIERYQLCANRAQGDPTELDSWYRFFTKEDEDAVNAFIGSRRPGVFAWIFQTKKWKDYKTEDERIKGLIRLELFTSHDYPCIDVYCSFLSEGSLAELIDKTARETQIEMKRNENLPSMADVIMSNRSFDIQNRST